MKNRVQSSDNIMGGWKQVFKPRFTKFIDVCCIGIVHKIVQIVLCLFCVQFLEPKLQFRSLLSQLSLPQLPEDVIGKDCNEGYGSYRDRGDCLLKIAHGRWQQIVWSSSEQMNLPVHLDTSPCKPHHWPRSTVEAFHFPVILLAGRTDNWEQTLEGEESKAQTAFQLSSDVLVCREHGMNPWSFQPGTVHPWEEFQVWYGLQPLTEEKQESVRKKKEEKDKHCH